jgi:hypothetical protein
MVDVEKIYKKLIRNFSWTGRHSIDPNTGVVNIAGSIHMYGLAGEIPVQFGRVDEEFTIGECDLESLKGAPIYVGGGFGCWDNPLKNLDHSPDHIEGRFTVSWRADLPLLRTLVAKEGVFIDAPKPVYDILNKYVGTGKKGSLAAAVELTKAGFKGNARW